MFDFITSLLASMGSLGVATLMLLENVFPPIPSEVIMPFAGYLAASGDLYFVSVVIAGTIGSVAGAFLWYWIGTLASETRLRELIVRHGRWLTISEQDLNRSLAWFRRNGGMAVFLGRMVPGVRTLISVPAGMTGMPLLPFLLYTGLGSLLWTAALTISGYLLEAQFAKVETWINPVTNVLLGGLLVLYVWRLLRPKAER
ncbi:MULTISPECIES: DedA family protein [unclassified Sulfitobacter]|jgi:membrane protein DedA with SNARE-associated domain|nr:MULTISPECIES: DedA family protein [unclassified Sulfitobacter]AYE85844.1 alkaline phosphatase [Sulfitobacter sp. D7]UWR38793.1 DedA family protein [Sulfitobacter sp. W074]